MSELCQNIRGRLLELAGPEGPPASEQAMLLEHLSTCADCRRELVRARTFLEAVGTAAAVSRSGSELDPSDARMKVAIQELRQHIAENLPAILGQTSTPAERTRASRGTGVSEFIISYFPLLFPPVRLPRLSSLAAAGTDDTSKAQPGIFVTTDPESGAEAEIVTTPEGARLFLTLPGSSLNLPLVITITSEDGSQHRLVADLVHGEAEADLPYLDEGTFSIRVEGLEAIP